MNTIQTTAALATAKPAIPIRVKYCLYARKSSESEEKQVLSIDSQIKEMLQLAEREELGLPVLQLGRGLDGRLPEPRVSTAAACP